MIATQDDYMAGQGKRGTAFAVVGACGSKDDEDVTATPKSNANR
jgi:hypothetical protein